MTGREFVAFGMGLLVASAVVNAQRGEWGWVALCSVVAIFDAAYLAVTGRDGAS